jgi:hypothetical protein
MMGLMCSEVRKDMAYVEGQVPPDVGLRRGDTAPSPTSESQNGGDASTAPSERWT